MLVISVGGFLMPGGSQSLQQCVEVVLSGERFNLRSCVVLVALHMRYSDVGREE